MTEALSNRFRVVAVDPHGCGRTPAWSQQWPLGLDDEVALLEPVWRSVGPRFYIVGHSYGGPVARKAALKSGERVESLTVYKPVLFGLLAALEPDCAAPKEIDAVHDDTLACRTERIAVGREGPSADAAVNRPSRNDRTGLARACLR